MRRKPYLKRNWKSLNNTINFNMKNKLLDTPFLAVIACLLWSSAFVGIKIGLKYTTPLQFAGLRFFFAGLLIMPFCGSPMKLPALIKKNSDKILMISFFQTFLLYALFYTGLSMVPGALGAIVIGSAPLFSALLAHCSVKDDKLGLSKFLSIFLGILGVILISLNRFEYSTAGNRELLGIFLLILANISSGIGNIIVMKHNAQISPLVLNSAQLMTGGLCLFLVSLPVEGFSMQLNPPEYYMALLWLSFLSAAAFSIWFILLKRPEVKVSDLNLWKFIIPVCGAILSWAVLPEEKPELVPVAGMLIIAASLILLNFTNRKQSVAHSDIRSRPL